MSECRTQEYLVLWKVSDLKRELPEITAIGAPGVWSVKAQVRRPRLISDFNTLVIGIFSECLPAYCFCL